MTKSLSKAIALATLVGATASAQAAINVNPDGLGEVLLYSLYSVEEGNITNINITNTTNQAKAVKVRFVEGQNSQEVLDFNLYLSPRDQWSGAVTATADGTRLITTDRSCTLPAIPSVADGGVEFKDLDYTDKRNDGGDQTLARTRVGHLEVIEMGVVSDDFATAVAGKNCGVLDAAFGLDGAWATNTTLSPAKGGLYGTAEIMNVDESTVVSYDAVALQGFAPAVGDLHVRPGSIYPNLNGNIAAPAAGEVASISLTTNNARVNGVEYGFDSTIQAISAVLASSKIHNNYVIDEGRASKSNWVITFPTKRFHVDVDMENGLAGIAAAEYDRLTQALANARVLPANWVGGTPATNKDGAIIAAGQALIDAGVAELKEAGTGNTLSSGLDIGAMNGVAGSNFFEVGSKVDYVNSHIAPFTQAWDVATGTACETIKMNLWDNDERLQSNLEFSPSRTKDGPQLCYETNILTYNDGKVLGGSLVTSNINVDAAKFQYGWMSVDFSDHLSSLVPAGKVFGSAPVSGDVVISGLPVIGFSAANFRNNEAKPGINNIYTSSSNHKATKEVVSAP